MFFGCLPCCGDPCCNITDGMGHAVTNLFTGSSPPSVGDTYTSPTMTGEYNVSNWYFYDIDLQDGEAFISPEGFGGPNTVPPFESRGVVASLERSPYIFCSWPGLTDLQYLANAAALRECNHLYNFNVFFGRRSKSIYGGTTEFIVFSSGIGVSAGRIYASANYNLAGLSEAGRDFSTFRITSILFSGQQIDFSTTLLNYGDFHLDSSLVSPRPGSLPVNPLQWSSQVNVNYELRSVFYVPSYEQVGLADGWVIEEGSFFNYKNVIGQYGFATLSGTSTFAWPEGFGLYPQDLCN